MRDGMRTKEKIERTAMRLFVEKGVCQTTTRDIASEAGVAEGTIYRHFTSKEDLVWELFSPQYTAFARTLDDLQKAEPVLRAKVDSMVRGFCRWFDADPIPFRFVLLVQHGQLEKVTPDMPNPVDVLRKTISDAMIRREIPEGNPDLATAMILGVVLQTMTFALYGRIERPVTELADALSAACWRILNP